MSAKLSTTSLTLSATPMLALMCSALPCQVIFAWRISSFRRCARVAAPARVAAGSATANSAVPVRETKSSRRMREESSLATPTRIWSLTASPTVLRMSSKSSSTMRITDSASWWRRA